ncbi:cytochrome P450 monooxygenase CYP63 [Amylostereum chailletii]|nr:cytochrome P450 monooxygenase CYP63 [Amylostereum chailletii]
MHPRHFRLRFTLNLLRVVAIPNLALWMFFRVTGWAPGISLGTVLYLLTPLMFKILWSEYSLRRQGIVAASIGGKLVPEVRGSWIGNIDVLLYRVQSLGGNYLSQQTVELFEEYKSKIINIRVMWADTFMTSDEGHVKYMLTGPGFEHFPKGLSWQERFESFLGNGIFNRFVSIWCSQHRQLARPWFSRERISDFSIFDKHTTHTLDIMGHFSASRTPFDIQDLVGRFTLDSSSEFLFGSCLNALQGPLPIAFKAKVGPKGSTNDEEVGSFSWAFEDVQVKVAIRLRYGNMWPLLELWNDKTTTSREIMHHWVTPLIERAVREKGQRRQSEQDSDEEGTFLSHLTDSTDDVAYIRDQVLNMLLAGRDTTASLLTFAVYLLALHPDITDKLRAEITGEFGLDGIPDPDTMRRLPLLRAVINETLRLFPPVPINARVSDSTHQVFPATKSSPCLYIPPNTQVTYNTMLIQRNKDTWGEDADEFKPSRWLDPVHIKRVTENPFMFIPFHAGPRICLGQNFAYNEASFFLVRLLQRFRRFNLASDAQPESTRPPEWWKERTGRQAIEQVWPWAAFSLYVKGGLWIKVDLAEE